MCNTGFMLFWNIKPYVLTFRMYCMFIFVTAWRLCGRAPDFLVKGTGVQNHLHRFEAWATLFIPLCLCLSEETVKAVGHFYLVSMPGEVKDPTQRNGKYLLWTQ